MIAVSAHAVAASQTRQPTGFQKFRSYHTQSRQSYGVNRITVCLQGRDASISRRRVCQLMHDHVIQGIARRRRFEVFRPRQLVVSDASVIRIRYGLAYLAVTLNLYSRKVLGWVVVRQQDAGPMMRVLQQQVVNRGHCQGMVHHFDQSSPYSSRRFQQLCQHYGIRQSMGSMGNWYDYAVVKAFFATLKREWLKNGRLDSLSELRSNLGNYFDDFATWRACIHR